MATVTDTRINATRFPLWGGIAVVLVSDVDAAEPVLDAVRGVLDDVDRAASLYREDAEITRVNNANGRPVRIGETLQEAIAVALRAARLTGGAVDPTVGVATGPTSIPGAAPRRGGDWRDVVLDRVVGTVQVPRPTRLDLGATGKAWAADRCAERAAAVAPGVGVLVSLAGDLAVAGPAPAGGWSVRVTDDHRSDPDDAAVPGVTVTIESGGLATSSITVRRRASADGGSVAHIVDPFTLVPVRPPWRTVSVAAATCVDANTASTAALVLGAQAPEWLARQGLPARLVRLDGGVVTVGGWPADPREEVLL